MFQKFIVSLSKALNGRKSTAPRFAVERAGRADKAVTKDSRPELTATNQEQIDLTCAFWRETLNYSDIEALAKDHENSADKLTLAEARQGRAKTATSPAKKSEGERKACLVVLGVAASGWQSRKGSPRALYILGVPAERDSNGDLHPQPGEMPFINPKMIQANRDDGATFITTPQRVANALQTVLTEISDDDAAVAYTEWLPVWALAEKMLCGALDLTDAKREPMEAALEELGKIFEAKTAQDWVVRIFGADSNDAAQIHMNSLYDAVSDPNQAHGDDLKTLHRLILGTDGRPALHGAAAEAADKQFFAHIDSYEPADSPDGLDGRVQFPLDPSQRQAVRHALALDPGEILAVNGPPGTDKTATLRAIIAGYWVRAALAGGQPPVILGCGATNQAVTNITNAFVEAPHLSDSLPWAQRWNPFVHSYGSFFPSQSFADQNPAEISKYQGFTHSRSQSARYLFEYLKAENPFDPANLRAMQDAYVKGASKVPELAGLTPEAIVPKLHEMLKTTTETQMGKMREITDRAAQGSAVQLRRFKALDTLLTELTEHQGSFAQSVVSDWRNCIEGRGGADRLDAIVEDAGCDEGEALRLLTEMVLDCTLRPFAFHLAARYWEGRLLETHRTRLFTATEPNLRDALERMCMLTPCLVSTVNMAPNLLRVQYPNPNAPRTFGFGMVDLLIMDESGQALPEMSAPLAALTKRAVFVGDLKQIKPVSKVQRVNEYAIMGRLQNSGRFQSLMQPPDPKTQMDPLPLALEELADRGMCSSDGAILEAASHASSFNDHLGRGSTLLFHYRCVQPIIAYCNRLSYHGTLRAKTTAKNGDWHPPLSWVEITAIAKLDKSSWTNLHEAKEIAEWLRENWAALYEAYGQKPIQDVVGVISAFKAQTFTLKSQLQSAFKTRPPEWEGLGWPGSDDIDAMTIGTVHALQGAEREMILFSAAVDYGNAPDAFFNSDASILNVAVSRAKSAFVFFGDPAHLFGPKHSDQGRQTETQTPNEKLTPSLVLGRHFRETPDAQRLYPRCLVIVESPKKALTIKSLLGKGFEVIATKGHFRELALNYADVAAKQGMRPTWTWKDDTPFGPQQVADLAQRLSDFERVILATDDDLEGEGIAWHVIDAFADAMRQSGLDHGTLDRIERVRLGAMTEEALEKAFSAPGSLDKYKAAAAIARSIADALIARTLQVRLNDTKAGGRVRAAILNLCATHEKQRDGYGIRVRAQLPDGRSVMGRVLKPDNDPLRFKKMPTAEKATERLPRTSKTAGVSIGARHQTTVDHGPKPLLSTIEILRRASRKGILPHDAYKALQALYTGDFASEERYASDDS